MGLLIFLIGGFLPIIAAAGTGDEFCFREEETWRAGKLFDQGIEGKVLVRYLDVLGAEQCELQKLYIHLLKSPETPCREGELKSSCFLRLVDERHRTKPLSAWGVQYAERAHDGLVGDILAGQKERVLFLERFGEAMIYGQRWLHTRAKMENLMGTANPLIAAEERYRAHEWCSELSRTGAMYLRKSDHPLTPELQREPDVQRALDALKGCPEI
jgi:hypothetical protein